jgi:7-cyano-7-deazaguanine synthase
VTFDRKALVLFSGGQDSATCLAWALENYDHVETIGFDYNQRHKIELEVRQEFISELRVKFPEWGQKLGDDHLVAIPALADIGETAMTEEIEIEVSESGLPNTFVPGRNIIFLSFAAALAYRRNCKHIVTGVCETDYSGYPDCRDDTIKSLQATLNLAMETRLVLHTPLMWIDKARTWQMADGLGGQDLVNMVKTSTHTCYAGNRDTLHHWGYGCGHCPACDLRKLGWANYSSEKV